MALAIPWHDMTQREQLVWAASYARHVEEAIDAALAANQAVQKLRELDLDNHESYGPEHYAAQHGPGLAFEEFRAWYPVAMKIAKKGIVKQDEISEDACRKAFNVYQQCSTDFY